MIIPHSKFHTEDQHMPKENGTSRRDFIERVTTSAIAIGVGSASLAAEASAAVPSAKPDESWLQGIKGSHAQIFDMSQPQGGFALIKCVPVGATKGHVLSGCGQAALMSSRRVAYVIGSVAASRGRPRQVAPHDCQCASVFELGAFCIQCL